MSIQLIKEDAGIRVRVDRAGERAVSDLLTTEEATTLLNTLATLIGFTVTPKGQ